MANPGFQAYFRPILEYLNQANEPRRRDIYKEMIKRLNLTQEDLSERTPSGNELIYTNRISWGITYLRKAGLIESKKRGYFFITEEGKKVVQTVTQKIDINFLRKYDSFITFQTPNSKEHNGGEGSLIVPQEKTPAEILEEKYQEIKISICEELISKVIEQTPQFFEKLIVDLLLAMGYGGNLAESGKVIGQSGDGGIDGLIKEDKLGLEIIYLQAKKWNPDNPVTRPEIQKFIGALSGRGARKGVFITTSYFTRDALEYTPKSDISLIKIDGKLLVDLMFEYNIGVSPKRLFTLKAIDSDYFE